MIANDVVSSDSSNHLSENETPTKKPEPQEHRVKFNNVFEKDALLANENDDGNQSDDADVESASSSKEDSQDAKNDMDGKVPNELEECRPEDELLVSIQNYQRTEWTPDGGWGWMVVIGGIIVHVYVGGFMKASGVMYIKLKEHFNQSAVATAWVFSLFTTFLLMMGPVASALCNRFSVRTVVFWGSLICFVGMLISAFAPNLWFLYFSYCILGGFGRCLTYGPSLILVTNYFTKRRGVAVGLSTAGVGLGMFSFPPLIEGIFGEYGYKGAMILLAGVTMHSFICAALFRPLEIHRKIEKTHKLNELVKMARNGSVHALKYIQELSTPKPSLRNNHKNSSENFEGEVITPTREFTLIVPEPAKKSLLSGQFSRVKQVFKRDLTQQKKPLLELSLLKDFPFLALCLSVVLFTMSMMSTFVFLPTLAKSRGVSQMEAAYLVSIIGVSDSLARFSSGVILDLKRIKPYRVLAYNGVMFGVAIVSVVMPTIKSFYGFAVASALYGILAGTYVAQKSVIVIDILGLEKMASSFGLVLGFQGIGSLIGPTISGLFKDVFGTYDEAFYFGGIGIFIGGCLMLSGNIWRIIRNRRRDRANRAELDKEIVK